MLTFVNDDLKKRVFTAINYYLDLGITGYIEDIDFEDLDEEECDIDLEISLDSEVYFSLYESEAPAITIKEFVDITEKMYLGKLLSTGEATTENEILFLIEPLNYETYTVIDNLLNSNNNVVSNDEYLGLWRNEIIIDGIEYTFCLIQNFTFFHLLYDSSEHSSKYYPSYESSDLFIQVSSNKIIEYDIARKISDLFIFEIASSHKIYLNYTFKPFGFEDEYYEDDTKGEMDALEKKNFSIFPLMTGKGIHEVVKIFNKALIVSDYDYKILCLTRVVEYVSPTVARNKINNEIIQKLSSPQIFNPDSNFVSELEYIFENNEKMKRDSELIKLTIKHIVDINEIISILPECIYKPKSERRIINKQEETEILNKLSKCIVDTRNEIAHAKANYQIKGNECPEDQKGQLADALLIVARQAIRWFSKQQEEKRVLEGYHY